MIDQSIALITTRLNNELYSRSSKLFPKDIQTYVIDGSQGIYGMAGIIYYMKALQNKGIEWLIMADEDILFVNPDGIYQIINEMKEKGYSACGIRDGGEIQIRSFNPYVINTFFFVINFKEISALWNLKEILKHQYIKPDEFPDDLSGLKFPYVKDSLYEPYYCFNFWLRRMNKKILFLNCETPLENDSITTLVKDPKNNPLLYHTWYARAYGIDEKHTQRIENVFARIPIPEGNVVAPIVFVDHFFYVKKKLKKLKSRFIRKIKSIISGPTK